jgi:hypothetical protein
MIEEMSLQNTEAKACRICEHIKDDGVRCGGPALSGEIYCRFHVQVRTHVSPEDSLYELPVLETEKSVQIALQHMTRALLAGKLSERKAAVMMSAIKTAAALIRQTNANAPKEALLNEIAAELRGRLAVTSIRKPAQSVNELDGNELAATM